MNTLQILVIDDDQDLADGLGAILEEEGHIVTAVYTGEDGLEQLRNRNFDLTFMNVKLPGISGIEAYSEICRIKPDIRIIIMTGYSVDQLFNEAVDDAGAVRVLRKPFNTNETLAALQEVQPAGIVLVFDDDPRFAYNVRRFLSAHDYRVLVAHNVHDAVQQVLASKIDVLVLDLRPSILRGLDAYLALKRYKRVVSTIIISGPGAEQTELTENLSSLPGTGCLFKPFDEGQLLQSIRNACIPEVAP